MKKLFLICVLAIFSTSAWSFAFEENSWFEVTIPINLRFPDLALTGGGIEMHYFIGEPNIGFGGSLVFGSSSYITLNTVYMLSIPYVDDFAVPLTMRWGLFADIPIDDDDFEKNDFEDIKEYFGFSLGAGVKYVGIPEWDFKMNFQLSSEWKYDVIDFITDLSPDILARYKAWQLGTISGFATYDGGGDGTYYVISYY